MGVCSSVDKRMRVLLLGLDSAGKTTVVKWLRGDANPDQTEPTVGFAVERVAVQNMELLVWDVSGQDKARPFWRHYYRGTSGVVFLVDSNDRQRIARARQELHAILDEVELEEAAIAVLANKRDLPEAVPMPELEEALGISELTEAGRTVRVFETVARNGTGTMDAFEWLGANMRPLGAS